MTRIRDVLANKNFFFLWLGQLISNFGDRLNQMALVALVYQRDPGSEIALAKLISFTIIPVFIIGPLAGVWVDRLNRRNIMIISDILRGLLVLSIPLFIKYNQILPVYLVIFIIFSIARFFIPSKMALIPEIVTKEKLLIANTLNDSTHMIGNVVGLVAAGVIVNIAYIGAIGGFYIDSATFFISAFLIAMMAQREFIRGVRSDLEVTRKAIGSSLRRSLASEIKEGIRHLVKYSDMRFVIYVSFLLMAGLGAISCVIIVFIQNAFGTSTRDLAILGMFLVGGLLSGSVMYGRFCQKAPRHMSISLSFLATGVSIIIFTILVKRYPNILAAGGLSALTGLCSGPIMVSINTLTHETIPEEMRGRIFSSLEAVIHLAFLIFMFIAAYAARLVDRFWILVAVGAIFSVCGVSWIISKKRRATSS